MQKFTPRPEQKRDALGHVGYEMEQVVGILLLWSAAAVPSLYSMSTLATNICLEGFLIHVRVLVCFFEQGKRGVRQGSELDDILACDYGFPFKPVDIGLPLCDRINKEIAHLAYSRTEHTPETKKWDLGKLALPLFRRCRSFAEHVLNTPELDPAPEVVARFAALLQHFDSLGVETDA